MALRWLSKIVVCIAAVWITPSSGAAPIFGGTFTSKIATISGSVAIPQYTVTDADGDTLTYSIDPPVTGLTIASGTGVVTANAVLTAGSLNYIIKVNDGTTDVTKAITNTVFTDDADPAIAGTSTLTASLIESSAVGTTVGITITVTDADTTIGDGFTYEITGADSSTFSMGYFDAVLVTAATLDFATKTSYTLTLNVKDSKRELATGTLTITVTENSAPTCNPNTISKDLVTGTAVNTVVATLSCTDPDGDTLTYALVPSGNTNTDFVIDAAAIKVANALDITRNDWYTFTVDVGDGNSNNVAVVVHVDVVTSSGATSLTNRVYFVAGFMVLINYLSQ